MLAAARTQHMISWRLLGIAFVDSGDPASVGLLPTALLHPSAGHHPWGVWRGSRPEKAADP